MLYLVLLLAEKQVIYFCICCSILKQHCLLPGCQVAARSKSKSRSGLKEITDKNATVNCGLRKVAHAKNATNPKQQAIKYKLKATASSLFCIFLILVSVIINHLREQNL